MPSGAVSISAPRVVPRIGAGRLAAIAPALLGFAVVAYLGTQGGGFEDVVRGQAGIALWWIAGLGAALGVIAARPSRAQLTAGGLLLVVGAWSLLSASWSESAERAMSEGARDVTLLGAFVLAATSLRREQVRPLVGGVLGGIALIGAVAILSRIRPAWFDEVELAQFLPNVGTRLSYPLNYWNALGALMAMGAPLGLGLAAAARTALGKAACVATLPVLALTASQTLSRGAIACAVAALVVLLVLSSRRHVVLAHLALGALGAALLIDGIEGRDAVRSVAGNQLAETQGGEMLALLLVVTGGVLLVALGGHLLAALREPRPSRFVPSPRARAGGAAALALACVAVLLAAGAPSELADRWEEFKAPPGGDAIVNTDDTARLRSIGGQGRYQYWDSMVDAYRTDPVRGIGAGSFENWWGRNGTLAGQVRNAHSLFAETLGELGLVGFLALLGFFGVVLVGGALAALRAGPDRPVLAGAVASCVAFGASAAVDWSWQVTVLPAVFVLLAAALLTRRHAREAKPRLGPRIVVPVLAVAAIIGIVPSMTMGAQLDLSRGAAAQGKLPEALTAALTARRVQPDAQTPVLQEALVLEEAGDLDAAAAAARLATEREPTNWRPWFVLARIEVQRGDADAGLAAYRRAKRLDRTSGLLR